VLADEVTQLTPEGGDVFTEIEVHRGRTLPDRVEDRFRVLAHDPPLAVVPE
jgi:hypothetical protein